MAKIISPVWSIIRGSIAGTTYLTTPSGMIIGRQRTKPVDTISDRRTAVKNSMITQASAWNELVSGSRDQWDVWAAGHGFATGRQAFMSGTLLVEYIKRAILYAPEPTVNLYAPNGTKTPSVAFQPMAPTGPGTGLVAIGCDNEGAIDCLCLLEISPPQNPARQYYNGPWDSSKTTCILAADASQALFEWSDLVSDALYFVRMRAVTYASGQQQTGHIVQAPLIVRQIATNIAP